MDDSTADEFTPSVSSALSKERERREEQLMDTVDGVHQLAKSRPNLRVMECDSADLLDAALEEETKQVYQLVIVGNHRRWSEWRTESETPPNSTISWASPPRRSSSFIRRCRLPNCRRGERSSTASGSSAYRQPRPPLRKRAASKALRLRATTVAASGTTA